MEIRVLLADDHGAFRQAVAALLRRAGFAVVAEAGDGGEALRLAQQLCPDVAVLDLEMPELCGIEAARRIKAQCPNTRIVVLTVHDETPYLVEAFRVGVAGYILKARVGEELANAIREVTQGSLHLAPALCHHLILALLHQSRTQ